MRVRRADGILFWALLALLVWVPIPLGSNRPWAWMVLELWAYALMAAWLVLWAFGYAHASLALRRSWPAWVVLGMWLALQVLEIAPMPRSLVALLNPEAARMESLVEELGAHRDSMTLSVEPNASKVSLLKTLAYVAIFFLVLAVVNRRSRLLWLARVLVYAAVAFSVYAVVMHLGNVQEMYFGFLMQHGDSASGTYTN